MKAFITGINGFVGKYLADYLAKHGLQVSGIDKLALKKSSYDIRECDLLNKEKLKKIISEIKPDYIFHLAAISSVSQSLANPELTKSVNVNGTKILFDTVVEAKINSIILVVSSLHVYGKPDSLPIKEDAQLRPGNPYAVSKVEQEQLCKKYSNLKIIISRSFNHTGPGQASGFVLPDFASQIANVEAGNTNEVRVGNLNIERDFTDVRDIVKAYYLAVKKCDSGEVYNICSGKPYSIAKIIQTLKSFSKKDFKIVEDLDKKRLNEAPILYGDNKKFQTVTGWKPQIPFEQTLNDILNYWRNT